MYIGTHILSQLFSYAEHKLLHGIFSVLPLFMILYILKNRLRRNDLGSVMITLSFLAETFGITFSQHFDSSFFSSIFSWWSSFYDIFCRTFVLLYILFIWESILCYRTSTKKEDTRQQIEEISSNDSFIYGNLTSKFSCLSHAIISGNDDNYIMLE